MYTRDFESVTPRLMISIISSRMATKVAGGSLPRRFWMNSIGSHPSREATSWYNGRSARGVGVSAIGQANHGKVKPVKQPGVARRLTHRLWVGMLGPMTLTPVDPALPTAHDLGLQRFGEVIAQLEKWGWRRLRVDTLVWEADQTNPRAFPTVRHHYDHGMWELYYELDKYWNPAIAPFNVARLDQADLPTVDQVLAQLFGMHLERYT